MRVRHRADPHSLGLRRGNVMPAMRRGKAEAFGAICAPMNVVGIIVFNRAVWWPEQNARRYSEPAKTGTERTWFENHQRISGDFNELRYSVCGGTEDVGGSSPSLPTIFPALHFRRLMPKCPRCSG